MESIWIKHSELPEYEKLSGDIKTDVLIIGGGIAGILCACKLKEAGVDCVIAEADRICRGVTENTTAKITSQHGIIYDRLIKLFGEEKAKMYLNANEAAIADFAKLSRNINCDFERLPAFVYSLDNQKMLEKEITALDRLGFGAGYEKELPLPFSTVGAVRFDNQAQFNPLQFLSHAVKGIKIFENTRVLEIRDNRAITDCGSITAENFVVATHFPFINKHGSYYLKLYQSRSYVISVKNAPNLGGMYIDGAENGMSFRNYRDSLLIGGGAHRTGKPGTAWQELESFRANHYPACKENFRWAAQDCMSLDGVPYIGRYSKRTANLFVATGFNKWGMSSSMAAASIISDMILGRENPHAAVFSPSRSILHAQLTVNAFEAVTNLLSFSQKRCPHLGCALKWNPHERSWDCPCHGSRFDENGKLLNNPSNGNLPSSR